MVEAAYSQVKKLVGRPGVFLLAPPGSSRGYILERLLREGAVDRAYAYPRLAEELRARGLAVGDLPSAEELERAAEGRVVVAVESSLQAVELKERLGKRAELIYLPKYFKEAAKDVGKELLEAAEVEHRGLGEGISPKLLRPGDKELKKGRDALLALSPGAVGFRDAAKEALGGLRFKIASAFLAELLSPAFAVLAVLQAVAPGAAPLATLLGVAVGVGKMQLEGFAARLLELFAGRREPRDKVAASFAKLVRRALEAEPYIDDDRLEAVVDQVALEWGMDVKTFKALVKSLAALAKDKAARQDLERLEEVVRREVENKLAEVEKRLKKVRDQVKGLLTDVKVAFVGDVEAGLLYHNFVVVGGAPRVKTRAAGRQGDVVVDVVAGGVFGRLAGEVLERLERDGLVVLVGPHGVGKSTLAAYVAWLALWRGAADAVVSAEEVKTGLVSALENLQRHTGRRFLLLYDPVPVAAYYESRAVGEEAEKEKERVRRAVEEALCAAGRGVKALVVLPDELYRDLSPEAKEALEKYVVKAVLNDVEFLHEVVRRYSGCGGDYSKLAEKIAQFDGGYTLVAKYAGLWLRERGCDVSDVERAVKEAKQKPKLFLAHYIWHVLLRGDGNLARKAAVPLLLHAVFGPVPVGVTYVTKAVYEGGVWRLLTPEELKGASLESLREEALEPIAKWLAQRHEDLVEETLRDLAGLNGEEARKPYEKALRDLIEALDWARGEVLNEGDKILTEFGIPRKTLEVCNKIFAELGVPEKNRGWAALLAYVGRKLTDVFKRDADKYLMIDNKIPRLLTYAILFLRCIEARHARDLSQTRGIKQKSSVLTPLASPVIIIAGSQQAARKTAEGLLAKWRKRGVKLSEVIYFLGLAALAAVGEVDKETVDLLLRVALAAVKRVTHPAVVWLILAALRPLGEKAPHIYVSLLAAASELERLDPETVEYIYDALQQLKDRLKAERLWPLVEAIRAYSNLLRKHSAHLENRREEAVEDMWQLYSKIRGRCGEAAPEGGLSAQCLSAAIAWAYVLVATLHSDLIKEAKAMRNLLEAVAHPEELERIKESDADLAEWVKLLGSIDDAVKLIERIKKLVLTLCEQYPALCEVRMSDKKDRKESQKRSNKWWMHA
jgi:hypothetical protein